MEINLPPRPEAEYILDGTANTNGFTEDQMTAYAREAVAAERERCAKLCEDNALVDARPLYRDGHWAGAHMCAAAIRGQQPTAASPSPPTPKA